MAQRIQVILEDDIDGTEATETVTFGLDGNTYEIDLNDEHATQLREAFAGYIAPARKVTGASRRGRGVGRSARSDSGPSTKEIRDWARSNGHEVSERGRVPASVREAFDATH